MMVRMPHAGCQCSGWCAETERQIFLPTVNRPDALSSAIDGGLKGYSAGSVMRPWYRPPSKAVPGGPRMVKCHSKRLPSSGAASKSGFGPASAICGSAAAAEEIYTMSFLFGAQFVQKEQKKNGDRRSAHLSRLAHDALHGGV